MIDLCKPVDAANHPSTSSSLSKPLQTTYDDYLDLFDEQSLPYELPQKDDENVAQSTGNNIWKAALVPVETQPPPPCL